MVRSYSLSLSVIAAFLMLYPFCCGGAGEYLPGSVEALIDLESLPIVDGGVRDGMFSSADPNQRGNDHGNYLRIDGDEYVMCEMEGPGVITRIWSANAQGKVRIYVDDREKPAIECMFKDIFEDRLPPFQSPICGKSSGGWYSYWPIAYEKYCRIAVTQDPGITAERKEATRPHKVSLSVKGAKELKLIVNDAGDGNGNDHANWSDAKLIKADGSVLYLSDVTDDTPEVRIVLVNQGWGKLMMDRSMKTHELCINGKKYEKGLGTHANSEVVYELKGDFAKFESEVGLDDFAQKRRQGSIIFRVEVDGKEVYKSSVLGFRKIEGALNPDSLYYHINYTTYPKGTKVLPFTRELSDEQKADLAQVLEVWKNEGTCPVKPEAGDGKMVRSVTVGGGRTVTLAELPGSGYIYSLKMKLSSADKRAYRRTIIKMYWDGEKKPSVWAPFGDFFGSGFGHVEFNTLPVGMGKGSGGGRTVNPPAKPVGIEPTVNIGEDESYCYWVMPFAKGARIEIENGSRLPVDVRCRINWRPVGGLDRNAGRFCAQWRNETGTKDKLVELLDVKGAGKFVGLIMSMQGLAEISYLEGNEQYFIDGEQEPSMIGTGTEDFFNGGWYYNRGVFDRPLHGLTEKEKTLAGRTSQYRFQVPDAVTFRKSFKLLIEHGTNNIHLDDDYATMTYFYMVPPYTLDYQPPAAAEMNFPRKVLVRPNLPGRGAIGDDKAGIVKMRGARFAEHVFDKAKASCPKLLSFWKDISEGYVGTNMGMFCWWPRVYLIRDEKHDPRLKEPYRGDVIVCDAKKVGDYLEVPAAVDEDGPGSFIGRYWLVSGPDFGQVRISMGGKQVTEMIDLYAEEVQPAKLVVAGPVELAEGSKSVRIEVVGRNERSKGMKFGLYADNMLPVLISPDAWNIIGAFPFDEKAVKDSFAKSWPPERELKFEAEYEGKQGKVSWKEMPLNMVKDEDYQAMIFQKGIPHAQGAMAYAQTFVYSPTEMEATLKLGHTRPVAIFLNGEKVYENPVTRRYRPDQDSVKVRLNKGANNLLVKTANTRGLWKVGLRFVDKEGKSVRGLEFMDRLE